MIQLWMSIENPFKYDNFKSYWDKTWVLTKNKAVEVEFSKYAYNVLEFGLDLRWRGSNHAGPGLEINLLGYTARVKFYDSRHWDDEKNDWEVYDD